ncbi:hypothetical protein IY145_00510 [Methylosinus sp. H3A]|uniref:hypothetical protein n=1 Tax=Methylosinus sp. H3A TaxID=2785786 RepID=UPI0018C1D2FD|nr:hypothetical protein [Methylosinus sp. H3A]MBG0807918.1 hypothetical protein [Methylosinus sp. H3A]
MLQTELTDDLSDLFCKLSAEYTHDIWHYQAKHVALRNFLAQLPAAGEGFILLKGTTVAHLADDLFFVGWSGDSDLILSDPDASLSIPRLIADAHEYKAPVQHEVINVQVNGNRFDFHKFFPVWTSVGASLGINEFLPGTSVHYHSANVELWKIQYEQLHAHRHLCTAECAYLDVAMAAFIQITHLYRDLIRLFIPWLYHRTRIRLQELLYIHKLCSLPSFDKTAFIRLTNMFGAADQVHIVASYIFALTRDDHLLKIIDAHSIVPNIYSEHDYVAYVWYGFSFKFRVTLSDLLLGKLSATSMVRRIPCNSILRAKEVRLSSGAGDIIHLHGNITKVDVAICFSETTWFEISMYTSDALAAPVAAFISFGDHCFQVSFDDAARHTTGTTHVMQKRLDVEEDGYRAAFELGYSLASDSARLPETAVVAIGELSAGHRLVRGALIALEIVT